jgi:putative NADPH-quinone reductase
MQILVVYAHPALDSYLASVLGELTGLLEARGHSLKILDLYEQGFDPVLRLEAWRNHREGRPTPGELDDHVQALQDAEGLIFVYPTWWYGLPAILKGWIDRVFQPQVAFAVENGAFQLHYLPNIRRFGVVTTYGSPRPFITWIVGDPVRRALMRGLKLQFAAGIRTRWSAIYNVDARHGSDLAIAREKAAKQAARLFGRAES